MHEKKEDIAYIQNMIWKMYKDFLKDHDMAEYNRKSLELVGKYQEKGDRQLAVFCYYLIFAWTPIINNFGEEFRMQDKR